MSMRHPLDRAATLTVAALHERGIRVHVRGRSAAEDTPNGVKLCLFKTGGTAAYANAQLDDYRIDQSNTFRWQANVRLHIRARISEPTSVLTGTAGFGFWNAPVGVGVRSIPSPPAAAWFFFAGPESNIAPVYGVPGFGWKAATLDARTRRFWLLLSTAPVALLLMRIPRAYRLLWPIAQRAMRSDEKLLAATTEEWHDYTITWTSHFVRFEIDGQNVHTSLDPPHGPMGFVAWIDNQYMIATPQGRFGQGVVPVSEPRNLEIAQLCLEEI